MSASPYRQLEQRFRQMYNFSHLASLAHWDMNVNMPPKGSDARGEALATVSAHLHHLITDPAVKRDLDAAQATAAEALNEAQRANLREMQRAWQVANALPAEFVERKAKLTTRAHTVWKDSRAANDFAAFLPTLQELVAVAREEGAYLAKGSTRTPYEALVNQYEPGLSLERLDAIFSDVRSWLPQLLRDIVAHRKARAASIVPLQGPFPQDKQEALGKRIMQIWQYDFDAGRLDISPHPFTGMTKEDCRITTNYIDDSFVQSLYGIIHETGHAKYEQNGGPRDMLGQPVCEARSLGVHESQSLLAEFQIGRSTSFIHFLTPMLREYFGDQAAFTPDNMCNIIQHVEPGYIRVDADEVCYPLHVILRYEIERALIEGTLEAADIPRVWNEKMKEYLGLETLGRDNIGCLQDVHWSQGSFGYFPTYALGAMLAAQLMAAIKKELGDDLVDKCIRTGDLAPIFAKQNEKIWSKGCLYETEELITKATGEQLNPRYLKAYLEQRYLS